MVLLWQFLVVLKHQTFQANSSSILMSPCLKLLHLDYWSVLYQSLSTVIKMKNCIFVLISGKKNKENIALFLKTKNYERLF